MLTNKHVVSRLTSVNLLTNKAQSGHVFVPRTDARRGKQLKKRRMSRPTVLTSMTMTWIFSHNDFVGPYWRADR